MNDISAFGIKIQVVGSVSFPSGFNVSQLADDSDPFDLPSIQIADKAMGVNGDLLTWSKANPLPVTLSVVPGSDDDRNLAVLFENNRVGRGKQSSRDIVTITGIYPDGSSITFSQGRMIDGMPGNSVASAGRLKSKPYIFTFENVVRS